MFIFEIQLIIIIFKTVSISIYFKLCVNILNGHDEKEHVYIHSPKTTKGGGGHSEVLTERGGGRTSGGDGG